MHSLHSLPGSASCESLPVSLAGSIPVQVERTTCARLNKYLKFRGIFWCSNVSRRNASNEGLTVDFAQMQKDKRYYHRLKAAEKISKKAERYQSTEDAKMNALREQFGLDRLTAAADGRNLPAAAAAAAPTMTSPQPAGHGEPDTAMRFTRCPPFDRLQD